LFQESHQDALLIYLLFWSDFFYQINLILAREFIFPLLALVIGGLVGLDFSFINHLYLKDKNKPHQRGFIYSADLIGSCLGALLAALFLIPLLGIFQTLISLMIINLLMIILLQRPRQ